MIPSSFPRSASDADQRADHQPEHSSAAAEQRRRGLLLGRARALHCTCAPCACDGVTRADKDLTARVVCGFHINLIGARSEMPSGCERFAYFSSLLYLPFRAEQEHGVLPAALSPRGA